jgi:trans-2,3-dihydro-3-hydroxyanthranilate isomerase
MAQHRFRILNVFTCPGDRLSGNPLAVFEDGAPLSSEQMQRLARQMNLSETTFVLPPTRPGASARVRIFTPGYEMPFAGHPTLGSAHVCRALGLGVERVVLEMEAGLIPVTTRGDRWTLQAQPPRWRAPQEHRQQLAALVGLAEADLAAEPLWVDAGREQLLLPIASEAAVRRAQPDREVFRAVEAGAGQAVQVFLFARAGVRDGVLHILSRFFFGDGQGGVREDPATGSAHANLGGWLLATQAPQPARLRSSQGEQTGRPSLLELEVDAERRVLVTGEVVELARGELDL